MNGYAVMNIDAALDQLEVLLPARHTMIVTIESCTGGGIAQAITSRSGSSVWFDRSWVTYSNAAKHEMVGVSQADLDGHGAVSEQVALAMVRGAVDRCQGQRLAISVTGIAGPGGGSVDKPVGLVYLAWKLNEKEVVERQLLDGDREQIRTRTIVRALQGAVELLNHPD